MTLDLSQLQSRAQQEALHQAQVQQFLAEASSRIYASRVGSIQEPLSPQQLQHHAQRAKSEVLFLAAELGIIQLKVDHGNNVQGNAGDDPTPQDRESIITE